MLQTVDADAKTEAECLPVCGLSSCFAAAAATDSAAAAAIPADADAAAITLAVEAGFGF